MTTRLPSLSVFTRVTLMGACNIKLISSIKSYWNLFLKMKENQEEIFFFYYGITNIQSHEQHCSY